MKPHLPSGANKVFYGLLGGNVVIMALIGFLALRPVVGLLQKHTTDITQLNAQIVAIQKKSVQLRKLKETFPAYEASYAPLLLNVPHTKDVAGYQAELEALAQATSNKLVSVDTSGGAKTGAAAPSVAQTAPTTQKPGEAKPATAPAAPAAGPVVSSAGGFPSTPVKVDLTGTYATVLDFIHRVETMDRITKVTAMDIESNGTAGAVRATLDLTTLYIPVGKS